MSYIETTKNVYKEAAINPKAGLCCTTNPIWKLPDLNIPSKMLEMNYGCGSTVAPGDLVNDPKILYVGVGGGMELLQFAYFSRNSGSVIGVDVVDEMIEACNQNLLEAENCNSWFNRSFIELKKGDALSLPMENDTIDVAAQNCLFNIFVEEDLKTALQEMYRVLKPHGKLVLSDPICEIAIPEALRNDETLRALCLSGSIPLNKYIKMITDVGFGTIEIRARRPYRLLNSKRYSQLKSDILIESIELCAIKDPMPADGPCVFTGRTAFYTGEKEFFDDKNGHILMKDAPLAVCDKTASDLASLGLDDIFVSEPNYHHNGGGCC